MRTASSFNNTFYSIVVSTSMSLLQLPTELLDPRRGLDILWTYHDAMSGKSPDPAEDPLRAWINNTPLPDIYWVAHLVIVYSEMLKKLLQDEEGHGTKSVRTLGMALTKGIPFLVAAVVDRDEKAVEEVRTGYAPGVPTFYFSNWGMHRFMQEADEEAGVDGESCSALSLMGFPGLGVLRVVDVS